MCECRNNPANQQFKYCCGLPWCEEHDCYVDECSEPLKCAISMIYELERKLEQTNRNSE